MKKCNQKDEKIKKQCPYQVSGFCNFLPGVVKELTKCKSPGSSGH